MASIYEGLTSLGIMNEKHITVVFDFGYAYTKIGFAGEDSPRAIVKSEVKCRTTGQMVPVFKFESEEQLIQQLVDFIYILYFKKLLANSKERRVVIIENILGPSVRKNALATVFFRYYEVLSLLFVPSHLVALMTLAVKTGLVLDIGYEEATLLPVFEGVPILNAWQAVPTAGKAIHNSLNDLLLDRGFYINDDGKEERLSSVKKEIPEYVLEDMKVRCCFVSTLERSKKLHSNKYDRSIEPPPPPPHVHYPLSSESVLILPGTVREMASEVLFEMDEDDLSLASIILTSILKCPVDTRRDLANNIFIIGGTAKMKGLKSRLLSEIRHLATQPAFSEKLKVDSFKIHNSLVQENCAAWLGGSFLGCTESALDRSVSIESYLKSGAVPDWSNLSFNVKGRQ
ncbi:UNVERIFIED_CONTAM: hypothetical protein RMT77_000475 [Armadillidium vulgare]